jgi:hypothetical protein
MNSAKKGGTEIGTEYEREQSPCRPTGSKEELWQDQAESSLGRQHFSVLYSLPVGPDPDQATTSTGSGSAETEEHLHASWKWPLKEGQNKWE